MNENMNLYTKWLNLKFALLGKISPWLINEDEFKFPYSTITKEDFYTEVNNISEEDGFRFV